MSLRTPIVVIAGPTGAGKTRLALELAAEFDAEIVGADSVQVYRGFDIGSAKPTDDELGGVRHHMLDIAEPDQPLDAMDFARLADEAIASAAERGKRVLVVGGTGLWLRALCRGLVDLPKVDVAIRARLEDEAATLGLRVLHARLGSVDPRAASAIHPNDALRVIRALEVFEQTGEPLGELRARHALGASRRPTLFLALEPDLAWLTERIDARVEDMIARGWVDEVRALRAAWGDDVRALGSVGYREWATHLRDGRSFDETVIAVKHATRLYARRQRNWFRAEPGVELRVANAEHVDDGMRSLVRRHLAP